MKINSILIVFIIIISTSCLHNRPVKPQKTELNTNPSFIYPDNMEDELYFYGFTVKKPGFMKWYIDINEQEPEKCIIRRERSSDTHTVFIKTTMNHLSKVVNSHDELEQMVARDKNKIIDNDRFILVEFTTRKTIRQGLWCIEYTHMIIDNKANNIPGNRMIIIFRGFVQIHPDNKSFVLESYFSERGREEELNGEFDKEGDAILDGISIVFKD